MTEAAGDTPLVGALDAVSAFSFGGGTGQFVSVLDALGLVILEHVNNGTPVFELDLIGTGIGNIAFQHVIFDSFSLQQGEPVPIENVSFAYDTVAITPEATQVWL